MAKIDANDVLRNDGAERLRENFDSSISKRRRRERPNGGGGDDLERGRLAEKRVKVIMGSEIKPEAIAWLWPDWLAQRQASHPRRASGRAEDDDSDQVLRPPSLSAANGLTARLRSVGNVIVWSGEDAIEDTLLPRFIAAGGDPSRRRVYRGRQRGRQKAQLRSGDRHGRAR